MARNGSGVYTKVNTFVSGNSVTAAGHNQNWDDLVTEMTNSVAADGQTSMTGPLKAASGTVSLPSHTFASDPNTGRYRKAADTMADVCGGAEVVEISPTGISVTGDVDLTGAVNIDGVSAFPVPTAQLVDASVTLPKLYQPSAVSLLLGSNSNAALTITGAASNGGPNLIRLTVASTSTFATGQKKIVNGVVGTTEANARWTITVVDATHIDLQSSTFTNAYVSGGTIGGGVDEITVGAGLSLSGTALTAEVSATALAGYLSGLELVNVGTSASLDITAGAANDVAFGGMMALSATLRKTTSSWTVGNAAGGLDTGAIATNTWYHFFLIKRVDTGVVDVLFSLSATAPTMPTNYTLKRRIGSAKTNGSSQWTLFTQVGDEFLWDVAVNDQSISGTPTGLLTLASVPSGVTVMARMNLLLSSSSAGANVLLHSPLVASQTQGTPSGNVTIWNPVATLNIGGQGNILTNTSGQVRASSNGTGAITFVITTYGWSDRRGK